MQNIVQNVDNISVVVTKNMHYTIMREVREENVHLFEPPIWNTPLASVGLLLVVKSQDVVEA